MRAIVLTGADNFFCAGGNLNRLLENRAKRPVRAGEESIDLLGEWIAAFRSSTKPVIAADRRRGGRRASFSLRSRAT